MRRYSWQDLIAAALLVAFGVLTGAARAAEAVSRDDALQALAPYTGSSPGGVDCATMTGKILCGYQGWFAAEGDGSGRSWRHYSAGRGFRPGSCGIDLWPDVRELEPDELFDTPFRHADGRMARVFSSYHPKTVVRHFQWMAEYGIDGAFVQRFAVETVDPLDLRHCNRVLTSCREGANRFGRCYAVMYDLSGLPAGGGTIVKEDWKQLVERMKLGRDPGDKAYLHHRGRPVVAVWGVGFNDRRAYSLDECRELIEFLKDDPDYGGNYVMLGVPTGWRTLDQDCVSDAALHNIILRADCVSPWSVGRFRSSEEVARHAELRWQPDLAWCRERGRDYLPVAFAGFSWQNLKGGPLNEFPRRRGAFLWQQYAALRRLGVSSIYQAMFDEMDEGTAIFKCTNDPPVGASRFVTYEGLPSDHYLWLAGQGSKLLRGEIPLTSSPPRRAPSR